MKNNIIFSSDYSNSAYWNMQNSITQQDTQDVLNNLRELKNKPFSMNKLNSIIDLCSFSIDRNWNKVNLQLKINPIQDFLSDDVLYYSKKYQGLESLNISFFEKVVDENTWYQQKLDFSHRKEYITLIKNIPELEEMIVDVYYAIYEQILFWLQSKKVFKQTSDIVSELIRTFRWYNSWLFTVENKYNNWDYIWSKIYSLYKNYRNARREEYWYDLNEKVQRFLQQQNNHKKELIEMIIKPLSMWETHLLLDSKFLYLDNGHYLYQDILYNSVYKNYFQKEKELINCAGDILKQYIYGKYIGLWIGSWEKDLELLNYVEGRISALFIDSSLPWLQEAELLFRWNIHRLDWGETCVTTMNFSQDWISNLLKDWGRIMSMWWTFWNPHLAGLNKRDFDEWHSFFAMLWGTFWCFRDNKIQFLKDIDKIMNPWDHILLSVFDIPKGKTWEIVTTEHYYTKETFNFVNNFFEKIWIPKNFIKTNVYYLNNEVCIDAVITPDSNGMLVSLYWKNIKLKTPITIEISRSERFGETTMEDYINFSHTWLKIENLITQDNNPFKFYILTK